jgi:PRTRC genetic system protein C
MALQKNEMKRKFNLKKNGKTITLADPSSDMTPNQVMTFYTNTYPELVNATVTGPSYQDGFAVYNFQTTVGTKG